LIKNLNSNSKLNFLNRQLKTLQHNFIHPYIPRRQEDDLKGNQMHAFLTTFLSYKSLDKINKRIGIIHYDNEWDKDYNTMFKFYVMPFEFFELF
jgi:hypothetical protein